MQISSLATIEPSEVLLRSNGTLERQTWPLSTKPNDLAQLLTELFTQHWQAIEFGPLVAGANYCWRCPGAAKSIELTGSYFNASFSDGQFLQICIAGNRSTLIEQQRPEAPSQALLFKNFDSSERLVSCGFEIYNNAFEPMISIRFISQSVANNTHASSPLSGLATWQVIYNKWLTRDAADQQKISLLIGDNHHV